VDDVTAAAGVAKGTFYLYFDSKEHLLGALRERFVDRFVEQLGAAVAAIPAEDWPARLDRWVAGFIRSYLDNAELHDILFQVADLPPAVNTGLPPTPTGNKPAEMLTALLEDGVAAGYIAGAAGEDPAVTATLLYSALHGAVHQALHYARGRDTERLIGVAQRLFRRAVMPWSR
jgi:AcrR family transcriptional regulator